MESAQCWFRPQLREVSDLTWMANKKSACSVDPVVSGNDQRPTACARRLRSIAPLHRCRGWDAGPLETELLVQADKLVGGSDAVLVIVRHRGDG
jgi:hypothetical protein